MYKLIDKSNKNKMHNDEYRMKKAKLYYRILKSAKTEEAASAFIEDNTVIWLTSEVLP